VRRILSFVALCSLLVAGIGCRRVAHVEPIVPAEDPTLRGLEAPSASEQAQRSIRDRLQRREQLFREVFSPGSHWQSLRLEQLPIDRRRVSLPRLIDVGRELFRSDFTVEQGLGNGLAARGSKLAGPRPAPNLRHVQQGEFGGPDATRCAACHHVGGLGGGGGKIDTVFILGDGERPDSALHRNPKALLGAGLLQALADEMSRELRAKVSAADHDLSAGQSIALISKGVSFGQVRKRSDGSLDLTGIHGVSPDLLVRPFGWKGSTATLRQMVVESLQQHLGIQADELVHSQAAGRMSFLGDGPADDPDADGVVHEATDGMVTALTTFLAALPPPMEEVPEVPTFSLRAARGFTVFTQIGCASCHVPTMTLEEPVLALGPSWQQRPRVDLSPLLVTTRKPKEPLTVRLYSDLRRHNLGEALADPRSYRGIPKEEWLTPPLWGVASSGPYLHDGRAPTVDVAIQAHGGEAATAATAYAGLSTEDAGALRVFLQTLTRPQSLEFKP
jgi:mono/diheme cytochrome c family protein